MTKVPQHMMDAIPSGATFVKHKTGSTWNDGGSWHRVYFQNADGSGGEIVMESDYRSEDLTVKPWGPPPRTYTQSEYDAAIARAEKAEAALSRISSYLGAGLGDETTSAKDYEDKIMWGIDYNSRALIRLAADTVERMSNRPKTTWGEVKSAILRIAPISTDPEDASADLAKRASEAP